MTGEILKHQKIISVALLIAAMGMIFLASPVLADDPKLTAQSVECQKHPECGSDRYWETQETFKAQFEPTDSTVIPIFKPACFNLNPAMNHPEVHPGLGDQVGHTFPGPYCACE
jgi:hypothetical protein